MRNLVISIAVCVLCLKCDCHAVGTIPFPPTIIKQPPHEELFSVSLTEEEQNKPFMLRCEANGNPEPTYRWTKNGEPLDLASESGRIRQQRRKGTLEVMTPYDTDEGIYVCYAENIHGIAVSNAVHLRKSELNSFLDGTIKEEFAIEGQPLSLTCKPPTGYPKPTVFWIIQSNSGAIRAINSSRIAVDPEGGLHFSNVTMEDALGDAQYACSATSMFRNEYKLGNEIMLRVEAAATTDQNEVSPTQLYVSPPNVVVLRDQKLELSCIFGGTPIPQIVWSKIEGSLENNRIKYTNYGKTLRIYVADFQDEGTYICTASNGVGAPVTHSMTVTVQAAPYWINVPNDVTETEDGTVSFECTAGGIPAPHVEWFMNGIPLKDVKPNPRRRLDESVNILTIEALETTDTAVFQCNATNIHGYALHNFYLNVLALPPTIIEGPEPITITEGSSMVILRCRVFGTSFPKVKWLRGNEDLVGNRFQVHENGDLEITDVHFEDEGVYTCHTSNKFGDAQASGRLKVKRPGPVAYFDAVPLGSSVLYLIWKRPLNPNGVLTGYNIYYREANGTHLGEIQARKPEILNPEETSAKLTGLEPDTKYLVDISATTSKGEGEKVYAEVQTNQVQQYFEDQFDWLHLPDADGEAGVRIVWVPTGKYESENRLFVQYKKKGRSTTSP